MPDANGNLKPISLSGKAGETWERVFGVQDGHTDDRPAFNAALKKAKP